MWWSPAFHQLTSDSLSPGTPRTQNGNARSQVSHSWSCDSCGHRFETSHHLRFNAHPSEPLFG
jgi:hypothetical protein